MTPLELPMFSAWATFLLALLTIIGLLTAAVVIIRSTIAQTAARIQVETIAAYKEKDRLMTEKLAQLEAVIATIQIALKRQGIEIAIDDDTVTLRQSGVRKTTVVRVKRETLTASRSS